MDLRQFISTSLLDIIGGLNEVEKQCPHAVIKAFTNTKPEFIQLGVTQYQSVEFEVLVRADARSGSEAKLSVVAAIVGGSVRGESDKSDGHSATLRFRVPLNLGVLGRSAE